MQHLLQNSQAIPLGAEELIEIAKPERTFWVEYRKLGKYKSIQQLLGQYDGVFILYTEKGTAVGHWVCMFKDAHDPRACHYFDPYGFPPEHDIKLTHNNDHLLDLIHKYKMDGYKLILNKHRFQKMSESIEDCGRHCSIRMRFRCLRDKEYEHLINSSKYNADYTVSMMSLLVAPRHLSCAELLKRTGTGGHLDKAVYSKSYDY